MKITIWLALAVCAWPALSLAQTASTPSPTPASAADPAAMVPAAPYRSAFDAGPRGVVQEMDAWPAANARVGQYTRGHSDILKWEQNQSAPPALTPTLSRGERGPGSGHAGHQNKLPLPLGEGRGEGKP